jgi:hypothetical protein
LHSMLNGTTKADKSASNSKAKGRRWLERSRNRSSIRCQYCQIHILWWV